VYVLYFSLSFFRFQFENSETKAKLTGIGGHLSRSEFDVLNDAYHTASTITAETGVKLESHLKSDLGSELPLHLSLSKPNVLTTAQREGFLELLTDRLDKTRIKPFVPTTSHALSWSRMSDGCGPRFSVEFTGPEFVSNNDRTRWFFVLRATKGEDTQVISRLSAELDTMSVINYHYSSLAYSNWLITPLRHLNSRHYMQKTVTNLMVFMSRLLGA